MLALGIAVSRKIRNVKRDEFPSFPQKADQADFDPLSNLELNVARSEMFRCKETLIAYEARIRQLNAEKEELLAKLAERDR